MKKVSLISGTGKHKGEIIIFPVHVCGQVSYSAGGKKLSTEINENCKGCNLIETAGGRYRELICLDPRHYNGNKVREYYLTAPEKAGLRDQLGDEYNIYVRHASVHGTWKLGRNQGVVIVPL